MSKPKLITVKTTVRAAIEDAISTIQDLASEMRDWYDSLPENVTGGDRAATIEEAADTLENANEPDFSSVPDSILDREISVQQIDNRRMPRRLRRDNATMLLEAAESDINDYLGQAEADLAEGAEEPAHWEDMRELASQIEDYRSGVSDVEFPGMMG